MKSKKDFNAPFDVALQKRFYNSKIQNIEMYNNDKIINIKVNSSSSYKKQTTILQLEFTGKHTNIIILDENRVILEALRHVDEFSSSRVVKVGIVLDEIPKQTFIPKMEEVEDIESFLYKIHEEKENQNLENLKKVKISQIQKKIKKLDKTIKSLPKKEELEEESKLLYEKANMILSNLHNLKPYQNSFKAYNYEGIEVEVFLDNEFYQLAMIYKGKAEVDTKFGKIKCLKVIPKVVSGRVFKEDEALTVYVSDDLNKIPVLIESPISVGSVKAILEDFDDLRNPMTSIAEGN